MFVIFRCRDLNSLSANVDKEGDRRRVWWLLAQSKTWTHFSERPHGLQSRYTCSLNQDVNTFWQTSVGWEPERKVYFRRTRSTHPSLSFSVEGSQCRYSYIIFYLLFCCLHRSSCATLLSVGFNLFSFNRRVERGHTGVKILIEMPTSRSNSTVSDLRVK